MVSPLVHPISQQAALLDRLRLHGPATRPELERSTGLGRRIVSDRITELLQDGLVAEGDFARSSGGRMPRAMEFRAEAGTVAVAKLNPHSVVVGLADLAGRLLVEREVSVQISDGPQRSLERIAGMTEDLLAETPGAPALWGVGVGVPAPVDPRTGRIVSSRLFADTPMRGWDGFDVRAELADRFDVGIWIDNVDNLMVLGELRAGTARGRSDVVLAWVGPGVGGGLVLGGRLQRGSAAAGEIGHLPVPEEEPRPCYCGSRGCLAAFVNEDILISELRSLSRSRGANIGPDADLQQLIELTEADGLVVLERAGTRVGRVLAGVVTLLDPTLLLLGGTIVTPDGPVMVAVEREIQRRTLTRVDRTLDIEHTPLSNRAGLVGAAFLAVDALFAAPALATWIAAGTPKGLAADLHRLDP